MRPHITESLDERGATRLIEYIMITGVLLVLMAIIIPTVSVSFIERPTDRLCHHVFMDVGSGISTRAIDLYMIAPGGPGKIGCGNITTRLKIPENIAGRDYSVNFVTDDAGEIIEVQGDDARVRVEVASVGAPMCITDYATSTRWIVIHYDSREFPER